MSSLNFCHLACNNQRCADCGRGYLWTRIRTFSCGRGQSADPPNKDICRCGPSADLKPRVLFAGPTSNASANGSAIWELIHNIGHCSRLCNKASVWLCGALGIVYWIQCNLTLTCGCGRSADMSRHYSCGRGPSADLMLADADYPRMWNLWIRTAHLW